MGTATIAAGSLVKSLALGSELFILEHGWLYYRQALDANGTTGVETNWPSFHTRPGSVPVGCGWLSSDHDAGYPYYVRG
jgi:hypothetical protein